MANLNTNQAVNASVSEAELGGSLWNMRIKNVDNKKVQVDKTNKASNRFTNLSVLILIENNSKNVEFSGL